MPNVTIVDRNKVLSREQDSRCSDLLHISVCIPTYRRPDMLDTCIRALQDQELGAFSYSIVVVDNDILESARDIVTGWQQRSLIEIFYDVERVPNISSARNKAIKSATGDLVAFIDDDEFPEPKWLLKLVVAYFDFSADGVLGPVIPLYEGTPSTWLVKSGLCARKTFSTGTILRNTKDMRTGNVLLGRHLFEFDEAPFNPQFGRSGGEDSDFFERKVQEGRSFIWCNEACVHEKVPKERQNLRFFVRRALVLGSTAATREGFFSIGTIKSIIALILYTMSLPVLLPINYHLFINIFIRNCNHGAKLLAHLGVKLIHERAL